MHLVLVALGVRRSGAERPQQQLLPNMPLLLLLLLLFNISTRTRAQSSFAQTFQCIIYVLLILLSGNGWKIELISDHKQPQMYNFIKRIPLPLHYIDHICIFHNRNAAVWIWCCLLGSYLPCNALQMRSRVCGGHVREHVWRAHTFNADQIGLIWLFICVEARECSLLLPLSPSLLQTKLACTTTNTHIITCNLPTERNADQKVMPIIWLRHKN